MNAVRVALLAAQAAFAVAGYAAAEDSRVLKVAPTRDDWLAAYARLSPKEQAVIQRSHVSMEPPAASLDATVYSERIDLRRGPQRQVVDTDLTMLHTETGWRLDYAAIAEGFNGAFPAENPRKWSLVGGRTYGQVETPGAVQRYWFELDWRVRDPDGRVVNFVEPDAGPDVVYWGAPPGAVVSGMNQAFALAFLEFVVRMEKGR